MTSLSQEIISTSIASGAISSSFLSSFSGSTSSSAFSSASSAATNGNNGNGAPRISGSSSLLFGCLITFLALFIAFMACGYASRRRAARYLVQFENIRHDVSRMKKPRLWNVWVHDDSEKSQWKNMMPLSASLVHAKRREKPTVQIPEVRATPPALHENEPPQEHYPSFYFGSRTFGRLHYTLSQPAPSRRPRRSLRVTSELSVSQLVLPSSNFIYPSSSSSSSALLVGSQNTARDENPDEVVSTPEEEPGKRKDVHAQISVLIAMPSPNAGRWRTGSTSGRPETTSICKDEDKIMDESQEGPPFVEIGIARVPIRRPTNHVDLQHDER